MYVYTHCVSIIDYNSKTLTHTYTVHAIGTMMLPGLIFLLYETCPPQIHVMLAFDIAQKEQDLRSKPAKQSCNSMSTVCPADGIALMYNLSLVYNKLCNTEHDGGRFSAQLW